MADTVASDGVFFKSHRCVQKKEKKNCCPLLSLSHQLATVSVNYPFMDITIGVAIHLAQTLITESVWKTAEDSKSFGLTPGTHLALPVKSGH